jgi:NitT/TauT family transport system substrate-binding protein
MSCKRFTLNFLILVALLIPVACEKSGIDKPIRLGYLQNDLHHLPLFVALEKGFFKQAGLDHKVSGIFRAGPEEMSAFAAGELDIGYVGQAPATAAYLNRVADIKFILQSNLEGSSIVVRTDSKIKLVSGLTGMTIAIPGHATMQDFLLRKALMKYGLSFNDIRIIVLKPPEMIQALKQKSIDAFIAWQPYPSQAEADGTCRTLISSADIWKNHPCCVLVAGEQFLINNPDKLLKIKEVHKRACVFIKNNHKAAVKIGIKYTGMDAETVEKAVSMIKYDSKIDPAKAVQFVDFLNELRYIRSQKNPRSIQDVFNH